MVMLAVTTNTVIVGGCFIGNVVNVVRKHVNLEIFRESLDTCCLIYIDLARTARQFER
jgi:hypothetical protein